MLLDGWRTLEFWLVGRAAVGVISAAIITAAVNIPIKKRLMTWDAREPSPDLMDQWDPWERIDSVRSGLSTAASALQAVAMSAFAS